MSNRRWLPGLSGRRAALAMLLLCALGAGVAPGQEPATTNQPPPDDNSVDAVLQATSSGEHLWMLIASPGKSGEHPFQLRYSTPAMNGPYYAPLRRMVSRPDRMLAVGDRLYTFSRRREAGAGWDVFSLQVLYNEPFDAYFAQPRDRMELHASLPDVEILGLTEHPRGPVALVRADRDVELDGATLTGSALLQLRSTGWMRIEAPAGIENGPVVLGSDMEDGKRLVVLTESGTPKQAIVHRSKPGTLEQGLQWTSQPVALDLAQVRSITRVDGRAVLVLRGADLAEVAYLRPGQVLPLATIDPPTYAWMVLGVHEQLHLLTLPRRARVDTAVIDGITGDVGVAQEMRPHPTRVGRIWFVVLLLGGAVSVTMLLVLIRPVPKDPVNPPKGKELLPPIARLGALAIDLLPAAVLTMLITGCTLSELFQAPLMTRNIIMSPEYVALIGLTMLHSTITELVRGTTLGKVFFNAGVVSHTGKAESRVQVLLRAMGKALTLLMPPIAIVALFNRNYQGLGDLLAQTLVVRTVEQPQEQ